FLCGFLFPPPPTAEIYTLSLHDALPIYGQWGMLLRFFTGHTNVLLPKFDPDTVWRTVEQERVNTISLIGDAMARPLIEAYERGSDRKSTRLNSSHVKISYAVFCLKKKKK